MRKVLVKLAEVKVVWWTDRLNMTIAVNRDVKPQTKEKWYFSFYQWMIIRQIRFGHALLYLPNWLLIF